MIDEADYRPRDWTDMNYELSALWVSRYSGEIRLVNQKTGYTTRISPRTLDELLRHSQNNVVSKSALSRSSLAALVATGLGIKKTHLRSFHKQSIPEIAYLEMTQGCNLRCSHCYMAATRPGPSEMSGEEWGRIVARLMESGVSKFILTGGEPLLKRQTVLALARYIKQRGGFCGLITNGTCIRKKELAEQLGECCETITVSLDGPNREVHDKIRGNGSFDRTVWALELLADVNADVSVNMTMSPALLKQPHELLSFARKYSFIKSISLLKLTPMGRCHVQPSSAELTEFRQLLRAACDSGHAELPPSLGFPDRPEGWGDRKPSLWSCGAGNAEFYITATGEAFPCKLMTNPFFNLGNVRKGDNQSFNNFRGSLELALNTTLDVLERPGCKDCPVARRCGGGCAPYFRFSDKKDLESEERWRIVDHCRFLVLKESEKIWGKPIGWSDFDGDVPFRRLKELSLE